MSLGDLQQWLLKEGIRDDLNKLIQYTVWAELVNLRTPQDGAPDTIDWPRLLLAGSIFARSDERIYRDAALRIATSAVTLNASQTIKDAGAILLGKLSNFRALALANQRDLLTADLDNRLGFALRIEAQRRQMDQSILVESSGYWLQANEFQQQFWDKASDYNWVSASAPTASGKTFVVLQWLIDQLQSNGARVAVYLAPTRALVSEIESNLVRLLGKGSEIEVSSLPLRDKYDAAQKGEARLILVFTQERLHLLSNILDDAISIDILIVDEAHKIGDNQRGVILQDAVERVGRANPRLKVLFISPGTENPEELLADAPSSASTAAVDSDAPTVLQNLILAEQIPRKAQLWALSIRKADTTLPLGVLELPNSPSNLKKRLAFIAAAVGGRGGTLVYANTAAQAEDVADLISQLLPRAPELDHELVNLADLAKKGVHPKFRLAPLVERGVAFHYGNMPSLIRFEIERLFRSG